MNTLEQYKTMLNSMDLEKEAKDKLISGFDSVTGVYNDLKGNLSTEREKTKPLKDKVSSIMETLGLNNDSTIEDVKTFKDSLNNTKALDELKETLTTEFNTKHDSEMTELRTLLKTSEDGKLELSGKYDDMQFRQNAERDGYFKAFIDNPLVKDSITKELKSKIIYKEGKAFINDGNGGIQKDISTGEPMAVTALIESLQSNPMYSDFKANAMQGNGSGVQSGKQGDSKLTLTEQHAQSSANAGYN